MKRGGVSNLISLLMEKGELIDRKLKKAAKRIMKFELGKENPHFVVVEYLQGVLKRPSCIRQENPLVKVSYRFKRPGRGKYKETEIIPLSVFLYVTCLGEYENVLLSCPDRRGKHPDWKCSPLAWDAWWAENRNPTFRSSWCALVEPTKHEVLLKWLKEQKPEGYSIHDDYLPTWEDVYPTFEKMMNEH
jgi:hypothetical protein